MKVKKKTPNKKQLPFEPEHVACAVASSLYLIFCDAKPCPQMDGLEQASELIRELGQNFTESGFLAVTCVTCLEVGYGFEILTNPAYALFNLFLGRGIDDVLAFLDVYLDNLRQPHRKVDMGLRISEGFFVDRFFANTFLVNEE